MNVRARWVVFFNLVLLGGVATLALVAVSRAEWGSSLATQGGAPSVVAYQGEVRVDGIPYTGDAYFKFTLVNAEADTSYWSNDGSSVGGGEPVEAVRLPVSDGLFNLLLGDPTLDGITQPLTAEVFGEPERFLRVWFSTSTGGPFSQLAPDTRIAAVPYALQAQEAMDADTVDGLHASSLGTHYQNVVVVAESGGDYASVQQAIDSIADAAADNPYLVWVAPGVYSETVTLKPHVHVQGAGQEVTVITSSSSGGFEPPPATLELASDTTLRDLTVGNGGADPYDAVALRATADTTRTLVADVTVRIQGDGEQTTATAIWVEGDGTSVTLQRVTAVARGGYYAVAIYSGIGATLEATGVTALAEDGTVLNVGLRNADAAAKLRGGSFSARGGGDGAVGIYTSFYNPERVGSLEAEGVSASGENGFANYGFVAGEGTVAELRGGSFTGRGGTASFGIAIVWDNAKVNAVSVMALAENGTITNTGLINVGQATLSGGSFTGRGGTSARGIYSGGEIGASLEASHITALGAAGSDTVFGLYSAVWGTAHVSHSELEGQSNSVFTEGLMLRVSNSRLAGGPVGGTGDRVCLGVSYADSFYPDTCP